MTDIDSQPGFAGAAAVDEREMVEAGDAYGSTLMIPAS